MVIPFIPLQFDSFRTNLTIEQAIYVLGRSLPLKHEKQKTIEVVSFEYNPDPDVKYQRMGGVAVYIKYFSEPNGVSVKVTVIPTVITILFLALSIGFVFLFSQVSPSFSNKGLFGLSWLFFYLYSWWETINTIKAVRNMFRDYIIQ